MGLAERFDARAVVWFLRLFGAAVLLDVGLEVHAGVWRVHAGELYPWRHLGLVPLYGTWGLAAEWSARVAAGAGVIAFARHARWLRVALRGLALVLLVAVLERYSNHGVLLFLVALFTSLAPPDLRRHDFEEHAHEALGLVRAQLLVVYVFSALNKLTHGFAGGGSLANLLHLPATVARPASWVVLAVEIALPVLLLTRPRVAVVLVVLVHAGFALLVPNVASFSLAMVAMALLFVRSRRRGPAAPSPSPSDRAGGGAPLPPPRSGTSGPRTA